MQTFLRVSGFPDFPRDQVLTWKQTRGGIVNEKTIVPFKTVIERLHCTSQHDEKSVYYAHKSAVEEMPLTKIVISHKITAF